MLEAFETDRLILRPFEKSDLDKLYDLYSSEAVMKYVAPPRNREETAKRLAKHLNDREVHGFGLFAAILKIDGTFIGRCGLDPVFVDDKLEGELAWMFFPECWNNGYATEFGERMIDIGINEIGLRRVFARAKSGNLASISVMEKIGMSYVGLSDGKIEYETVESLFDLRLE